MGSYGKAAIKKKVVLGKQTKTREGHHIVKTKDGPDLEPDRPSYGSKTEKIKTKYGVIEVETGHAKFDKKYFNKTRPTKKLIEADQYQPINFYKGKFHNEMDAYNPLQAELRARRVTKKSKKSRRRKSKKK